MNNGIHAGQVTAFLHNEYGNKIHSNDIHRLIQIAREKSCLNTGEKLLSISEMQKLIDKITKKENQYHIKYIENTQIMHYFFY